MYSKQAQFKEGRHDSKKEGTIQRRKARFKGGRHDSMKESTAWGMGNRGKAQYRIESMGKYDIEEGSTIKQEGTYLGMQQEGLMPR